MLMTRTQVRFHGEDGMDAGATIEREAQEGSSCKGRTIPVAKKVEND